MLYYIMCLSYVSLNYTNIICSCKSNEEKQVYHENQSPLQMIMKPKNQIYYEENKTRH